MIIRFWGRLFSLLVRLSTFNVQRSSFIALRCPLTLSTFYTFYTFFTLYTFSTRSPFIVLYSLYSLYFFCLTQISQISQRTHRILAFAVRMVRSPFTIHRSSFFTFSTFFTLFTRSPFIVHHSPFYFLYFLVKRSTNNAFF